ncbi:Uncharacterised protein [Vibrio cholerae]|uniref:Uncharacterized protein n=1 Tax=Vibrio cholerae TaxID=666 RepID=A0A655YIQ2_VIBCL|nr:Uncharacterised protein [Vibrio cholerae]
MDSLNSFRNVTERDIDLLLIKYHLALQIGLFTKLWERLPL